MGKEAGEITLFTSEMIEIMARIWTHSFISLVDVRHTIIHPERPMQQYRMPSSMLVYTYGGPASVQLNTTCFDVERFGVFHGGKGTILSISPEGVPLTSVMVLYRSQILPSRKKELQRLLEQVNPFVQRFGCVPSNPIWLIDLFQRMMDNWGSATEMSHFNAKNMFVQALYEIYSDLQQKKAHFLQPDPVVSAKRYLDKHYKRPIMFQEIADMFTISGGQLTRLFKKKEGISLQAYLSKKRLEEARHYLLNTNATLKEIAYACGLVDELNLIRLFKRHYKITPSEYRKIKIASLQVLDIDNNSQQIYNEKGPGTLAQYHIDGELNMFGQTRSKEMILAAAMSLLLLLTACGSNVPANNNGVTPSQVVSTQTPQTTNVTEAAWPRTYVDVSGAEVVIEKQPKRIAVLHYIDIERLLAFDLPPDASVMAEYAVDNSLTLESLRNKEIIDLGGIADPNMEVLIEAEPDLIIVWERHRELREEMEKIAPVIEISYPEPYNETHYIREIGKIIGQEEQAEKLIAERDANIAKARNQLTAVDETVIFVWADAKGVYGMDGLESTRFYSNEGEGLGLKAPESLPEAWSEISLEGLAVLDPDHIFVNVDDTTDEEFELLLSEFSKSNVWNTLTAVQNNQVYRTEESTYRGGVLGMYLLSNQVIDKLLK